MRGLNIFGIGGYELLIIIVAAVFIVGPRRVGEMVRDARRVYSELRRQRENITAMVSEELEVEELKKDAGLESLSDEIRAVKEELALDQEQDEDLKSVRSALRPEKFTLGGLVAEEGGGSVRKPPLGKSPQKGDAPEAPDAPKRTRQIDASDSENAE